MKTKEIILFLLGCAVVGSANEVQVRRAWTRTFQNPSIGIFPDHLGNIAAVSEDTKGPFLFLLNSRGRTLARTPALIPSLSRAIADSSGRIFVMGDDLATAAHCTSFAPMLSRTLWVKNANLTNAGSPPWASASTQFLIPDETGGAFVVGLWYNGVFVSQFTGGDRAVLLYRTGLATTSRPASAAARSRAGEVFWITGSLLAGKLPSPTVYKYSPSTMEITQTGANWLPTGGGSFFLAAECDSVGNLILVGWHTDDALYRRGRCHIMKMDSQLNVLWQGLHGPLDGGAGQNLSAAGAVAVDANDDIIMMGDSGTVKYSAAGQLLWEAPITGATFNLDRFGSVFLSQPVERKPGITESEITKLNADGTRRWQTRYHDGSRSGSRPAGLVLDNDGNVYLATSSDEGSTIVKFVERGARKN
jgi:outer membrane protein assembly factor BamB